MADDIKKRIIDESKRIEEDCLFSAKGHFNTAQFWTNFHYWIGVPTVVLAAIAGCLSLSLAVTFISIIVAAATAVITFVNPNEKASIHHNAGTAYNALRSEVRLFYSIEVEQSGDHVALTKKLTELNTKRSALSEDSLQIPQWAYFKAKQGIEGGENTYKVDI